MSASDVSHTKCRDLLVEWLDTPFFETREEWQEWVSDFRPRVESAILWDDTQSAAERARAWDRAIEIALSFVGGDIIADKLRAAKAEEV